MKRVKCPIGTGSGDVSSLTLFEKTRVNAPSVRRGSFHMIDLHQQGGVALKTLIAHSLGPQFINFGSVCIGVNSELIRNKRLKVVNNHKLNLASLWFEVQTELLPESGKDRIREAVGCW